MWRGGETLNKVLIVGELVKRFTISTNSNYVEQGFVVATVREPKDPKKQTELHFIYCKAFGKILQEILSHINEGDILCVSGQLATVARGNPNDKEYRVELWAESIRAMPEKLAQQNITNPDRLLNDAIRSYDRWDNLGEKTIYTVPDAGKGQNGYMRSLQNVMKTLNQTETTDSESTDKTVEKDKEKALS